MPDTFATLFRTQTRVHVHVSRYIQSVEIHWHVYVSGHIQTTTHIPIQTCIHRHQSVYTRGYVYVCVHVSLQLFSCACLLLCLFQHHVVPCCSSHAYLLYTQGWNGPCRSSTPLELQRAHRPGVCIEGDTRPEQSYSTKESKVAARSGRDSAGERDLSTPHLLLSHCCRRRACH
jgi:hypothetical protein